SRPPVRRLAARGDHHARGPHESPRGRTPGRRPARRPRALPRPSLERGAVAPAGRPRGDARRPRARRDGAGSSRARRPDGAEVNLADLTRELHGMTVITDPNVVRVKSKDFYWYSPVLKRQLDDKVADVVVTPRSEADVVRVARACVAAKVPLT